MGKEKCSFTGFFFKGFLLLEVVFIFLCGFLGTWLARRHYQNNREKKKDQIQKLSQVLYVDLEKSLRVPRFKPTLFTKRLESAKKNIEGTKKIKIVFVLNAKGMILSHIDKAFIGQKIENIYHMVGIKENTQANTMGVFQDIFQQNKQIEYEYFYQYFLGHEVNHPLYTVHTFPVNTEGKKYTSMRRLYIIWEFNPVFLFSWFDGIIALFMITHISFACALLLEKRRRQVSLQMKKWVISDVSYLNDRVVHSPVKLNNKIEKKDNSKKNILSTKIESREKFSENEIPEAIVLK